MSKDVHKKHFEDLFKKVEPILIEYGLTKGQASEVFYNQVKIYENQLGELKLPGVREEDLMDEIRKRIPKPFRDESFIDRVKQMKDYE